MQRKHAHSVDYFLYTFFGHPQVFIFIISDVKHVTMQLFYARAFLSNNKRGAELTQFWVNQSERLRVSHLPMESCRQIF